MGRVTVEWHGDRAKREAHEGAADGLERGAEHLGGVSNELCPIEEGTLVRTGTASVDRAKLKAAYSYGTPYAIPQHERMDYQHDPGKQAKYLEQPFHTERAAIREIVAAAIRRRLGT